MYELLVTALLDLLAFLELSGDDTVDPDAAVEQLEEAARTLRQLGEEDRERLVATIEAAAAREEDPARRAFFLATPEALGLRGG